MGKGLIKQVSYIDPRTQVELAVKRSELTPMFTPEEGYLIPYHKRAWKRFPGVQFPLEMTKADRANMDMLADNMWGNSNMLGYRGHGRIVPYDMEGIGDILNCAPKHAERFIKRMMQLGLVAKIHKEISNYSETQYYLNPAYYCGVKRINHTLYTLFAKDLQGVVPGWAVELFVANGGR